MSPESPYGVRHRPGTNLSPNSTGGYLWRSVEELSRHPPLRPPLAKPLLSGRKVAISIYDVGSIGGPPASVASLLYRLALRNDMTLHVIIGSYVRGAVPRTEVQRAGRSRILYHVVPVGRGSYQGMSKAVEKLHREQAIDAVLMHGQSGESLAVLETATRLGVGTIRYLHGGEPLEANLYPENTHPASIPTLPREAAQVIAGSDATVVMSGGALRAANGLMRNEASRPPIHVLGPMWEGRIYHRPVDPDTLARLRKRLGISPDQFVVQYSHAALPGKGWADAVRAIDALCQTVGRENVVLLRIDRPIPPGFDSPQLRDYFRSVDRWILRRGLRRQTVEIDEVHSHEAMRLLNGISDVMVLPSYGESLGLSALESSCPVVAYRIGGLEEAVRDFDLYGTFGTGFLTELGSVESLAGKLVQVYRRRRNTAFARHELSRTLDSDRAIEGHERVIADVIRARHTGSFRPIPPHYARGSTMALDPHHANLLARPGKGARPFVGSPLADRLWQQIPRVHDSMARPRLQSSIGRLTGREIEFAYRWKRTCAHPGADGDPWYGIGDGWLESDHLAVQVALAARAGAERIILYLFDPAFVGGGQVETQRVGSTRVDFILVSVGDGRRETSVLEDWRRALQLREALGRGGELISLHGVGLTAELLQGALYNLGISHERMLIYDSRSLRGEERHLKEIVLRLNRLPPLPPRLSPTARAPCA